MSTDTPSRFADGYPMNLSKRHRRAADEAAEIRLDLSGDVVQYIGRHEATERVRQDSIERALAADPQAPEVSPRSDPWSSFRQKLGRFRGNLGWNRP